MVLSELVLEYIFVKLQDLEKVTELRFLLGLSTKLCYGCMIYIVRCYDYSLLLPFCLFNSTYDVS